MALLINSTYTAISPNLTTSLAATGGASPYTLALLPGALGSLNPTTGIYTAPNSYCVDTVLATDAFGAQATQDILVGSAIQLVCDIISTYMQLSEGRVFIYNSKWTLPTDSGLYIAVGVSSLKSFGNSNRNYNGISTQGINMHAALDINIMSRSLDALNQKEQILLAFNSNYAESQMEKNSFYVGSNSTHFVNLSGIDGTAIPYRFTVSTGLLYFQPAITSVPYFDDFPQTEVSLNS